MSAYDDDYDDPTSVQGNDTQAQKPANQDQKTAILTAAGGLGVVGGAAYAMSRFLEDEQTSDTSEDTPPPKPGIEVPPNEPKEQTPVVVDNGEPNGITEPVNPTPLHEQTFEEAFAAARAEQGPGHYFEWHGQTYNTYFDHEWEAMSHHDQQEFLATVPGYHAPGGGASGISGIGSGSALAENHTQPVHEEVPPTIDDEVLLVDDETPVAANTKADFAVSHLDDHEVVVFDVDHDNRPDGMYNPDTHVIVMDTDGDHILDTRGVIENHQVTQVEHIDSPVTIDGNMELIHQQGSEIALAEGIADPTIASEHHTLVAQHTSSSSDVSDSHPKIDYAVTEIDGHEVIVVDIDNDNRPDGIFNPDTHIIALDTDGDHILDTRAVYDEEHNQFAHAEHIDGHVRIDGNMDILHQAEAESLAADDTDLGPDFNNHGDTSDFDYYS